LSTGRKKAICVIGAGNWLILHDRVGPRVLELIRGRYGPEVEICESASTGLSLLDHLRGQDLLIVVDAAMFGGYPGQIREIDMAGCWSDFAHGQVTSVHQIGPFDALNIARKIYPDRLPHDVLLIIVETDDIDPETLDCACKRVSSIIDQKIEQRIKQWRRMPCQPAGQVEQRIPD
jgi:hydrogenase maturation protease